VVWGGQEVCVASCGQEVGVVKRWRRGGCVGCVRGKRQAVPGGPTQGGSARQREGGRGAMPVRAVCSPAGPPAQGMPWWPGAE